MSALTRRGFFGRLAATVASTVAVVAAKPQALALDRGEGRQGTGDPMLSDPETGISLRFIRSYSIQTDQLVSRVGYDFREAGMNPNYRVSLR